MLAVAALVSMTALAFDSVSVVAVDALQTYTPLFAVFLNPVTITVLPLYRLDAPLVMAPVYTALPLLEAATDVKENSKDWL